MKLLVAIFDYPSTSYYTYVTITLLLPVAILYYPLYRLITPVTVLLPRHPLIYYYRVSVLLRTRHHLIIPVAVLLLATVTLLPV